MKLISILILLFFCYSFSVQEPDLGLLEKMNTAGKAFTKPLKQGQIESLKNVEPPEDTWVYSRLEEYKQNLDSENLMYGQIIMPSADEKYYSYNLFAYDKKKEVYYFVAIVSFKIIDNDVEIEGSYLFTEGNSLKMWWRRIFGFYESDLINNIPEKYLFKTCPPLPFKI